MVRDSNQPLSLQIQKFLLDQTFAGTVCKIRKHELTWEGWLRPSAVSYVYHIRLVYKLGSEPDVFLLEPDPFALAHKVIPDRPLPHNYGGNPLRLCLFMPGSGEWKPTDPLATTIIPWAVEWLWFFEDWVFTNIWSGGGIHPGPVMPERPTLPVSVTPATSTRSTPLPAATPEAADTPAPTEPEVFSCA